MKLHEQKYRLFFLISDFLYYIYKHCNDIILPCSSDTNDEEQYNTSTYLVH